MALIDVFRAFHPKAAEYTLFSRTHGTFSKVDHMLGHKISLKKIEIMSNVFSKQNSMKLEINYKKKTEKHTNTWMLNNRLLNSELLSKEIKKEIKRYLETKENENMTNVLNR